MHLDYVGLTAVIITLLTLIVTIAMSHRSLADGQKTMGVKLAEVVGAVNEVKQQFISKELHDAKQSLIIEKITNLEEKLSQQEGTGIRRRRGT